MVPSRSTDVIKISPARRRPSVDPLYRVEVSAAGRGSVVDLIRVPSVPGGRSRQRTTFALRDVFPPLLRRTKGRSTAAVLTATLSAPICKRRCTSSSVFHAASHGERHEALVGDISKRRRTGWPILFVGRDVPERSARRPLRVVDFCRRHRMAGVSEMRKVCPSHTRPLFKGNGHQSDLAAGHAGPTRLHHWRKFSRRRIHRLTFLWMKCVAKILRV